MLAVLGLIYNKLLLTDGLLLHESADYNVFNKYMYISAVFWEMPPCTTAGINVLETCGQW